MVLVYKFKNKNKQKTEKKTIKKHRDFIIKELSKCLNFCCGSWETRDFLMALKRPHTHSPERGYKFWVRLSRNPVLDEYIHHIIRLT